jgi:hypothetical protein
MKSRAPATTPADGDCSVDDLGLDRLGEAIRAAYAPDPIVPATHEVLVEAALARAADEDFARTLRNAWSSETLDTTTNEALLEAAGLGTEASPRTDLAMLASAWSPEDLDPAVNERLLALALGETTDSAVWDAPPNDAEHAAAEELARALDGHPTSGPSESSSPELDLARSLRAAVRPVAIDELTSQRLVRGALASPRVDPARGRGRWRSAAAAGALALAASLAGLMLGERVERGPQLAAPAPPAARSEPLARVELAAPRSASALFAATDFPAAGGERARADRIAAARTVDLRNNRFAAWGVR